MKYCFIIVFVISNFVSAQIENPLRFPFQDEDDSYTHSSICGLQNGDILFFWINKDSIYSSKSNDVGSTWNQPEFLFSYPSNYPKFISSIVTPSGRIIIGFKGNRYSLYSFSDNNGENWSVPDTLPTSGGPFTIANLNKTDFSLGDNGEIYFTYSINSNGVYYLVSTDNGMNWVDKQISSTGSSGTIITLNSVQDIIVYQEELNDVYQLMQRVSTNNGATWSEPSVFLSSSFDDTEPKFVKDSNNKIWLFFNRREETPFEGFYQHDIKYTTSTDGGLSWSSLESFTNYKGDDLFFEVNLRNNQPIISFSSTRNSFNTDKCKIFYGIAGVTEDNNAPPFIHHSEHFPLQPGPLEEISIRCFADDENEIESVKLIRNIDYKVVDTLSMFDDGMHNDSLTSDGIYGCIINGLKNGEVLKYSFLINDVDDNSTQIDGHTVTIPLDFYTDGYLFNVNDISLPLNNKGLLSDVLVNETAGGKYKDKIFLFIGGFFLSGNSNGKMWANATERLNQDYLPGKVGSIADDPRNSIYVIEATDPPFGNSWQNWKYAVSQGADFFDGNDDKIYNPVDLNGNGLWDLNEDRPDILGDHTAWCIYNDGVPKSSRMYNTVDPQGIEIHQTIFGVGDNSTGPIRSMLFIRYRILNKGLSDDIDSVYFTSFADPDIGQDNDAFQDDLIGVDTLMNAGYTYNNGEDSDWGINPPAFFIKVLQGAPAYTAGETFNDNNSNGTYEDSIDTPLDTARINNGLFIGSRVLPGATNRKLSSFISYFKSSSPPTNEPNNAIEARNYMLGLGTLGEEFDPCDFNYGEVRGHISCDKINPHFLFSGDPVQNIGWLDSFPTDKSMMINTGPFNLKKDEPVDIWIAYIVGQGYDNLNSITVAREYAEYADNFYKSNFTTLPVGVNLENPILNSFELYQNYPNPFNPVTTIKYQIPGTGKVTLKVYDVLGQDVRTLVNKELKTGSYEISFDASYLSSGIYFYELKTEKFSSVKKMILIK